MDHPQDGQKTALVTGVGVGGIGGALATQLHREGYFVLCAARRPDTISSLLSPGMLAIQLDVTAPKSVEAALERVSSITGGRLSVLVNNAGAAIHRPALDLDVDGTVANMFNVNVLGVMRMVKAFSGLLIEARGTVVNIGSIAPIVPLMFSSAYNASKAALHAYGDALKVELAPFGVQVVTVITGGVKSNIRESDAELPPGSRYNPIRSFWLQRVNVSQSQSQAMPTEEYARSVIAMVERRNKPLWFWAGGSARLAWFLYYFFPKSWRLWLLGRRSNFGALRK